MDSCFTPSWPPLFVWFGFVCRPSFCLCRLVKRLFTCRSKSRKGSQPAGAGTTVEQSNVHKTEERKQTKKENTRPTTRREKEMSEYDAFEGYVPETIDPGLFMLVAVVGFSIFSNSLLPCLVSFGSQYEKRKILAGSLIESEHENDVGRYERDRADAGGGRSQIALGKEESGSSVPSSFVHGRAVIDSHHSSPVSSSRGKPRKLQTVMDKVSLCRPNTMD